MKTSHKYALFIVFELLFAGLFIPQVGQPRPVIEYLHRVAYQVLFQNRARLLRLLATERSGEYVLPEETQAMIALLRRNGVKTFHWSPRMDDRYLLYQRLVEGAYPITVQVQARYTVGFADEAVFKNMKIIDRIGEVVLAADH